MNIISLANLRETKWKNGGGITREIASAAHDGKHIWRLSRADIEKDGPFSDFADYIRILTVLDGQGMILRSADSPIIADPLEPVRFSGALKTSAQLNSTPVTAFNVMFDPRYCDGDVKVLNGTHTQTLTPTEHTLYAIHGVSGDAKIGGEKKLFPGDTVLVVSEPTQLEMIHGDTALLVTISSHNNVTTASTRVSIL